MDTIKATFNRIEELARTHNKHNLAKMARRIVTPGAMVPGDFSRIQGELGSWAAKATSRNGAHAPELSELCDALKG